MLEQITPTLQTTPSGSRWLPVAAAHTNTHCLRLPMAPNGSHRLLPRELTPQPLPVGNDEIDQMNMNTGNLPRYNTVASNLGTDGGNGWPSHGFDGPSPTSAIGRMSHPSRPRPSGASGRPWVVGRWMAHPTSASDCHVERTSPSAPVRAPRGRRGSPLSRA